MTRMVMKLFLECSREELAGRPKFAKLLLTGYETDNPSFHHPNLAEMPPTCQYNEIKNTRNLNKASLRVAFHIILRQKRNTLLAAK